MKNGERERGREKNDLFMADAILYVEALGSYVSHHGNPLPVKKNEVSHREEQKS